MADIYIVNGPRGEIEFDFTNSDINFADTYDDVRTQEVYDAACEAMFSPLGIGYPKICGAAGKEGLNPSLGVYRGIAVQLLGYWKVYSRKTSGTFTAWGGCLLPSFYGKVFKPNQFIEEVNILEQYGTLVTVNSGSGLSAEEHNRLMSLPQTAFDSTDRQNLTEIESKIDTVDSLVDGLVSGQLTKEDFKKYMFNRSNTVANEKITQYQAGDDAVVSVTYDADGVPTSEALQ